MKIHSDGIPWWDGIVLQQVFFCFSWAHLHNLNRVKCSHLSFLARENEVKCLHSLMIIMDWFLGQHNPSNYFALTVFWFVTIFTFHNVSINTLVFTLLHVFEIYLHSTMFLLIRNLKEQVSSRGSKFTFHNVSINTVLVDLCFTQWTGFTFHNVSINTGTARG